LQTIPSDPSLIKDWVSKFDDDSSTAASIPNTTGEGFYRFVITRSDGFKWTTMMNLIDLTEDSFAQKLGESQSGAAASWTIKYVTSTNVFEILKGTGDTLYITQIDRWEDVAGADAQMSVPVDGWETVFEGTPTTTILNNWGFGTFEFHCDAAVIGDGTFEITLREEDINTNNVYSASFTNGVNRFGVYYNSATNQFTYTSSGSYTGNITRVRKFNSLVNVLHSYHPDPRSVAQKDWVEVYNDPAGASLTVTNQWGTGTYIMYGRQSSGYTGNKSGLVQIDDLTKTSGFYTGTHGTYAFSGYNTGGYFGRIAGTGIDGIYSIYKWQDSQASDAPRTVLDDGWETLKYDDTDTSQTGTYPLADGLYELTMSRNANESYPGTLFVDSNKTICHAGYSSGSQVYYTTATGAYNTSVSGMGIQRIRKFTGLLRISAQYNVTSLSDGLNEIASINTDAGDVDVASYFADPTLGKVVFLKNAGTNGNHLINCPNSIEIGDRKSLQFRYVDGWNYEDCIIDEYPGTVQSRIILHTIVKWAGGRMEVDMKFSAGTALTTQFDEPFMVAPLVITSNTNPNISNSQFPAVASTTTTSVFHRSRGNSDISISRDLTVKGRWKAGE